jgi:hypothetical protein
MIAVHRSSRWIIIYQSVLVGVTSTINSLKIMPPFDNDLLKHSLDSISFLKQLHCSALIEYLGSCWEIAAVTAFPRKDTVILVG